MRPPSAIERGKMTWPCLAALVAVPVLLSLAAFWSFDRGFAHTSLFALTNLVGPTTESLLQGRGMTACTDQMGTPGNPICFHAGRMPLPTLVVALGVRLFGDRFLPVACFKLLLLLVPLEAALALVWRRLVARGTGVQVAVTLLLLAPFAMTALLADVVNLQVEEGYTYSLLACGLALVFFPLEGFATAQALAFGVAAAGLYLAKSSMALATVVLTVGFLLRERKAGLRALVLLVVGAAPLGWAVHQHHAAGRYALGTSLDGMNLHKGNHAGFLARYPPPPGESLDGYDSELNAGHVFADEWSFDAFHRQTAVGYLRGHPRGTVAGDLRKLEVLFVSLHKVGSSESRGVRLALETGGLLLFRVLLWTAIVAAVYGLLRRRPWAGNAAIFLALLAAIALPYLLGFAYTRHASILIYPAALFCCRVLLGPGGSVVAPGRSERVAVVTPAAAPFAQSVASVLLDAVRAGAALLVCLGHWRYLFFVDYPQLTEHRGVFFVPYVLCTLGHQAVIVFFVLSGYLVGGQVLRALGTGRWSWRAYLLQRGVRLWTVLIPALALGALLDLAGVHLRLAPRLYAGLVANHITYNVGADLTWAAFFGNVFFVQSILTPVFGSNGALWSLANEFWYYLLFPLGLLAVRPGYSLPGRVAFGAGCVAIAVFVNRGILLLFPLWLLGVVLAVTPTRRTPAWARWLALAVYAPFFAAVIRGNLLAGGVAPDYALGLATFALLWVLLGARRPAREGAGYARVCRTAAGCSYTLYLVHTPMLMLLAALCVGAEGAARWLPDTLHLAAGFVLLAGVLVYAYGVAWVTEFRTPVLRAWLLRRLGS